MSEIDTYYLVHSGDDYPSTFIRFSPDGEVEKVLLSSTRYEVFDSYEDYGVESSNDEDEIVRLCEQQRLSHDLATVDEDGEVVLSGDEEYDPRFYVSDCLDADFIPDWFGGFGTHYVRTDAWRGYTTVDYDADEWQEVASGWLTGYPDGTTRYKMTAADLHNGLYDGTIPPPPVPVVWFFGFTSNVFSQTSDILIPVGTEEVFAGWLETVGFDGDEVRHAFS